MQKGSNGLLVDWHDIKFFAVLSARRGLVYPVTPEFRNDLKSLCWLFVAMSLLFSHVSGLLVQVDTSLTSKVRCLTMFKFEALTIGAFFQTICFGVVARYGSAKLLYESYGMGVIDLLRLHC